MPIHILFSFFAEGSDDITVFRADVQSTNQSLGEVIAEWEEPKEPNGLIYMYQIEYNRVDLIDVRFLIILCVQCNFLSYFNLSRT